MQELNNLSTEVDLAAPRLPSKSATPAEVEKVIRLLEPRCQAATLFPRLRAAATQWSDNGGYLSRALLPEPAEDGTTTDAELSAVLQHKVLAPGFTLQSKAFMATFNNRTWSRLFLPLRRLPSCGDIPLGRKCAPALTSSFGKGGAGPWSCLGGGG